MAMNKLLLVILLLAGLLPASAYTDLDSGMRVFLTRDPAGFVDGPNLYAYVKQNPWTGFDFEGLDAVYIVYPNEPITVPAATGYVVPGVHTYTAPDGKTKSNDIGHAGVLLVDPSSGKSNYYEYGRYDAAGKGVTREKDGPQMTLDKDGHVTKDSATAALKWASDNNSDDKGGKTEGIITPSAKAEYDKQKAYADQKYKENDDKNRTPYSISNNNCGTFGRDTCNQGLPDDQKLNNSSYTPSANYQGQSNGTKIEYDPKKDKPADKPATPATPPAKKTDTTPPAQ